MIFLFSFSLPVQDPVLIFSIVLFIILLAPILLNKIKVPSIMGLIIAGMVIGPNGFQLLERDSSIILFGTVGLLYIMFLAGLELDMNDFKRNKNKSIVFGSFTFAFPFILGIPVCYYFLDYSFLSSVLIASMFSTHTLVSYPIASRLGITKNEAVTIAVGGTIITDTVVLLILAIITGSAKGNLDVSFWAQLGVSIAIFSVVVFWLFPLITRWFFKNIEGENSSQYIFVLAMVFLAGFLAEVAGIEPIIGAFMAGLALNRLIPHTSPLMNRIEFVGNAIFIPFFLIGVGMLVDLRVLFNGFDALIVAGTLTVVAVIGKWLGAFFTQKIFKYNITQRNLIFGLSSAHAAATLAVILIGYNLELVDESALNGTILLILVTCLVSSFVTESAGKKIAIEEQDKLPEISETTERILVPIANPNTIEKLIDIAVMLKNPKNEEPIYPLAIVKDDDEAKEKVLLSTKMLEKAIVHASATENNVQIITRVDLNIASGIIRAIKELMITEVVIGWTEKQSSTDRFFGTTLTNILQHTDQLTIVCKIINPVNTIKRLVVFVPANAHLEVGFLQWIVKLKRLSTESGADILFYGIGSALNKVKEAVLKNKPEVAAEYKEFSEWEDFLILGREITEDDLIVVVSARRGTISHHTAMENLPLKVSKHFKENSFIVLYPDQDVHKHKSFYKGDSSFKQSMKQKVSKLNLFGKGETGSF